MKARKTSQFSLKVIKQVESEDRVYLKDDDGIGNFLGYVERIDILFRDMDTMVIGDGIDLLKYLNKKGVICHVYFEEKDFNNLTNEGMNTQNAIWRLEEEYYSTDDEDFEENEEEY